MRHVLSIVVENKAGVLGRVVSLFSRRGYNIDSLSVGTSENVCFSRITVSIQGDEKIIEQIRKQVAKIVDVQEVVELKSDSAIYRELCLIKVEANGDSRPDIFNVATVFRANIIDVSIKSLTMELIGDLDKINAFVEVMKPYGVLEIVRTGLTAIARGAEKAKN
jgi:acetolactate synthase-1/3 small subunit